MQAYNCLLIAYRYYFFRPKWVKLGNLEYPTGAIIYIDNSDGILPKFVVVKEILFIHSKPLLKVFECVTHGLDEHYCSYIISKTN